MAQNTSRFNKILNFIGLVDEQDDGNMDYDQGRPQGSSTYNPSSRRQSANAARPVRQQGYDEPRGGRYEGGRYESGRYESSRYDSGRYESPRYESRYDTGRDHGSSGYRSGDYGQQRSSSGNRDYARNAAHRDEFDVPPRGSSGAREQRAPKPDTRSDYYSSRPSENRDYAPSQQSAPEKDNVVAMRRNPGAGAFSAQTVIYYLHALEECRDVISDLLDNKTILLNLEDMDERLVQRGIDTLCGAAFALNATLRKASDKTYLIAPNSVNVDSNNENPRY